MDRGAKERARKRPTRDAARGRRGGVDVDAESAAGVEPGATDVDTESAVGKPGAEANKTELGEEELSDEELSEEEPGEEEAAVEAEVVGEDEETVAGDEAPEPDAVVELLLRRTGVLPADAEIGDPELETTLPPPRRKDEFVCAGCFLIKARVQLGDAKRRLCRDCAEEVPAGNRHPHPGMAGTHGGRPRHRRIA